MRRQFTSGCGEGLASPIHSFGFAASGTTNFGALQMTSLCSSTDISHFLNSFDSFLIDCDGVLWSGNELFSGTNDVIKLLQEEKKDLIFVTNNSTKSRRDVVAKFTAFHIDTNITSIITSSYAIPRYLSSMHSDIKHAYVIGSSGLFEELHLYGITTFDGEGIPQISSSKDFEKLTVDPRIQAVIVGCDFSVNYTKLAYASLCLQLNKDCIFIATSRDSFDQLKDRRLPGMTLSISSIEASSGKTASIVGKPSSWLINDILTTYNLNRSRTCMIGDRLDSDILFGKNGNISTLLVLTGCTTEQDLINLSPQDSLQPDYIISHLSKLQIK